MVEIVIVREDDREEFGFSGHANAGKKGNDIVCASISSLAEYLGTTASKINEAIGKPEEPMIEAGNTVITFHKPIIKIKDGSAVIKTNEDMQNYSYSVALNLVITSAIETLGRIAEQYPKNVSLKIFVPKANKIEPDTKDVA